MAFCNTILAYWVYNMENYRYEDYSQIKERIPCVVNSNIIRTKYKLSDTANWHNNIEIQICCEGSGYVILNGARSEIGVGDIVAVTTAGRILTVILVLYGIFVIALIPGVVVNYFVEFNKIRYNESLLMFMDRLEHLDTLSKEELRDISQNIRNFRGK